LDGAEPWVQSDCAGDVPIVVASDAKAQSDIYSAVTLAGVLGTDCVVLAGPRDATMPADQRARLAVAAPGGWVLGGTAAVPPAKLAGNTLQRLGGANRWETAQRIGRQARLLATGALPATSAPDLSLRVPSDSLATGVFLSGAGPWVGSDCTGDTPIVVASDAAGQSDIYSAVTLAGALGTDCVILAGPRGDEIPASQRSRLAAAATGGFVLGGTAAVPSAKISGRAMTRLAGADRWTTAQLVGRRASGDTTAGTDTAAEQATITPATPLASVIAGNGFSCALRADRTITCWGKNTESGALGDKGQLDAPTGTFTAIAAFASEHGCGLRTDRTIACWGANTDIYDNVAGQADAPAGTFAAIAAGGLHSCGVRTNGTLTCWGRNDDGQTDSPVGTFTAVAAGAAHSCAVRTNGTVRCWGSNERGQAGAPGGTFTAVSAGWFHSCGLRTDGSVACWGADVNGQADAPAGTFTAVAAGGVHSCGIRANGSVTCWGERAAGIFSHGQTDSPTGVFDAIAVSGVHSCAMRTNGTVACWGQNFNGETDVPDLLSGEIATRSCAASGAAIDGAEAEMIRLVNDLRARVGVTPLVHNAEVGQVARRWSQTMCETGDFKHNPFFSEQYPTGLGAGAGENIAQHFGVRQAFDALVDSQGHYENMVRAGFTSIGVGVAIGPDGVMWFTQNFSSATTGIQASTRSTTDTFRAVSASDAYACGLRTDGTITCWGLDSLGQTSAPSGTFTAIDTSDGRACGLRTDGTVTCWGAYYEIGEAHAPTGTFTALAVRQLDSCGLRTDGTIACWANGPLYDVSLPDPPSGTFSEISGGAAFCGLRTDRTIVCWGESRWLTNVPSGTFTAVSAGFPHACGLRTDGTVTCWGYGVENWLWDVPSGPFAAVSAGVDRACGLCTDGTIACWGHPVDAQSVPPGIFTAVSAGWLDSCALRADGTVTCWGWGPTAEGWNSGPTSDA